MFVLNEDEILLTLVHFYTVGWMLERACWENISFSKPKRDIFRRPGSKCGEHDNRFGNTKQAVGVLVLV